MKRALVVLAVAVALTVSLVALYGHIVTFTVAGITSSTTFDQHGFASELVIGATAYQLDVSNTITVSQYTF